MTVQRKLLLVCIENSNRSQMAEAFARLHGGDAVQAFSAGSQPSGKISPKAIAAMGELGCDLSQQRSKSLDELTGIEFDAAITMGCGDSCPNVKARLREDWAIPQPRDFEPEPFREVRDQIEREVLALLKRLGI